MRDACCSELYSFIAEEIREGWVRDVEPLLEALARRWPYHCSQWDEAWPLSFYNWHCWDEPEPTLGPFAMQCVFCGKYGDESTLDAVSGDGWGCGPCVDGYQRGD